MLSNKMGKPNSENLQNMFSLLRALYYDAVPVEFMPQKEDVYAYLRNLNPKDGSIHSIMSKYPVPTVETEYEDIVLARRRRSSTKRPKKKGDEDLSGDDSDAEESEEDLSCIGEQDQPSEEVYHLTEDVPKETAATTDTLNAEISHEETVAAQQYEVDFDQLYVEGLCEAEVNIGNHTELSMGFPDSCAILEELMLSDEEIPITSTDGGSNSRKDETRYTGESYFSRKFQNGPTKEKDTPPEKEANVTDEATIEKGTVVPPKEGTTEVHKPAKKLIWPLNCWLCKEPMDRRKHYIVCKSTCKRAYHVNCEGSKASKLQLPLCSIDEATKTSSFSNDHKRYLTGDVIVKTTTDRSYGVTSEENSIRGSDTDDVAVETWEGENYPKKGSNPGDCKSDKTGPYNKESGVEPNVTAPSGYDRVTPNCISRPCIFCLNSYRGCSRCYKFKPINTMARCAIQDCTSFYCYPECLNQVRTVVPDNRVIELHHTVYGNVKRLLDDNSRPIFICHGHTCWSCFDCDRYSYYWESTWRTEAHGSAPPIMNDSWQNLRITCRGKVETSHFSKNKKLQSPPHYPDVRNYRSYLQSKRLSLYGTFLTNNMDELYPISDDETYTQVSKTATNVLLRCIRCERTWCTHCLHPDMHIVPHSAKQMICQDCIQIEVSQSLAMQKTEKEVSTATRYTLDPHLDIQANNPREMYEKVSKYLDECDGLRNQLALQPCFLDELFIEEPDLQTVPPSSAKKIQAASNSKILEDPKGNSLPVRKKLPNTLVGKSDEKQSGTELEQQRHLRSSVKHRLDNMKCKEFNEIVQECDDITILRLCDDFKYITNNIITDESLRTMAEPMITKPCACFAMCDDTCVNFMRHIECNPINCSMKEADCGNRRFRNMRTPKLILRPVEGKGIGAFATDTIQKNDLVCEYVGEVITQNEFQRCINSWSFAELDNKNKTHWYIMKVHKEAYIDSTNVGNVARFINHSCEPNCLTVPFNVVGTIRMGVIAQRRIEKGEEVCYNYGFSSRGVGAGFVCMCGSKTCRGIVGVHPDDTAEALEKIQSLRSIGAETDTLSQLMYDMSTIYVSKEDNRTKPRPSPIDVFNGMLTAGDLYRYEHMLTRMKMRSLSVIDHELHVPPPPVAQILADNLYIKNSHLNYVKLLVLGGLSIKEWDMANTKMFASSVPWGIVALENNKVSMSRALDSSCAFPDFYEAGKRFMQIMCMVAARRLTDKESSENLQEIIDLTWGSTENCFACNGYGDCKYCESCGDVLHDENNCGDFYVNKDGLSVCSVCQNSDHREKWLTVNDTEREQMAMELWSLRMEMAYNRSMEVFRTVVTNHASGAVTDIHGSPKSTDEESDSIFIRPESLFCTNTDYERFCKDPMTFYDSQVNYNSMCKNAIQNYDCFF